ncbi:MAG: hypothetical protein IPF39_16005 [Comamonadaceae bacterium]|uniref:hypothetical protein n=1 Tax=Candidatus Skiveiella danica TaxID=3386177 RepID=UPI00390A2B4E|nr:hypothetical protein [Comamonadaceae bacterium]
MPRAKNPSTPKTPVTHDETPERPDPSSRTSNRPSPWLLAFRAAGVLGVLGRPDLLQAAAEQSRRAALSHPVLVIPGLGASDHLGDPAAAGFWTTSAT